MHSVHDTSLSSTSSRSFLLASPIEETPLYQESMAPRWMQWVLLSAAIYNAAWGAWVILFPLTLFQWMHMPVPNYPELWQCVGMIVGCYALGYAIAVLAPYRYWPVVLVGLVGKLLGPIGFVKAVYVDHTFSPWFGLNILTNDLLWWIPFFLILQGKYNAFQQADKAYMEAMTQQGERLLRQVPYPVASTEALNTTELPPHTLWDETFQTPVTLVFLRHTGCIYCQEMLATLAKTLHHTPVSERKPVVIVHMSSIEVGEQLLRHYGLDTLGVCAIADPERRLYKWAGLPRGTFNALFGWKVWLRGFQATLQGHRASWLQGDGFQLSGEAVCYEGQLISVKKHPDAQTMLQLACGLSP
ncbi:MAG: hypothetical protein ACKO37_00275 [Vampirovibrionales bacterium]